MVLARIKCPDCNNIDEFFIPRSGLDKRARGVSPTEAFTDIDPIRIKQLADHLCADCRP